MAKRKPSFSPSAGGPAAARRRRPAKARPGAPAAASAGAWLFGTHAVLAALANPRRRCRRLLLTTAAGRALEGRLPRVGGLDAEICERPAIDAVLAPGTVHQGIALLADRLAEPALDAVLAGAAEAAVVVVLDQATDPRNVGAVLRSAAAFGAAAVIVPRRHASEATGALAKAASGALEWVPLVRAANLARALGELKEAGFWCLGLDAGAGDDIAGADLGGRVALVLGSEGRGLRRLTRETCDRLLRVPMSGAVGSLNLSTAAAIALYEVARRRP